MRDLQPSQIKIFLARRMCEAFALCLMAVGVGLVLILGTYTAADPSINTVGSIGGGGTTTGGGGTTTTNLFGNVGAAIASLVIQSFGVVAAWGLVLPPIIWGVRIFRHQPPKRIGWRILALIVAVFLLAFSSASIDTNYGGALGTVIANFILVESLSTPLPDPFARFQWVEIISLGAMILAAVLYIYGSALGRGELGLVGGLIKGLKHITVLLYSPFTRAAHFATHFTTHFTRARLGWHAQQHKNPRKKPSPRREPVMVVGDISNANTSGSSSRKKRKTPRQPMLDLENQSGYRLPPVNLLAAPSGLASAPDEAVLDTNSRMLETVLAEFGVRGEINTARFGPVVTRYELILAPGIKTQRVVGLADDIARSMAALSVRIAVIPGQNVIGIELPNAHHQIVMLRDILDSTDWATQSAALPLALGMDIAGTPMIADLARMPHLLVAGTTGSGKSVGINAMIVSLLLTHTPESCRFIMVDPKMLELSVYDGIPHLLTPVVTDPGKAVVALKWTVREMENRYRNMAKLGVRNIDGYNKKIEDARRKGENLNRRVQTGFDSETGQPVYEDQDLDLKPLPFIVVIIDEVADLMLVAGKDIEAAVQRLAQMARAAGIHVVMATQRPSVDVITGTIKANFPTRISFQVTSKIDSRTILGEQGAEQLLGKGDMLYMEGGGRIVRVHGPFLDDKEVESVARFLREQGEPVYDDTVITEAESANGGIIGDGGDDGEASLYEQAVRLVAREGKASTSFVQRHLRIGYNRAATIIEDMEKNGVVSAANHAGKREVLIDEID